MRISDWSSDRCSSDLDDLAEGGTDDNADSHVEDAAPHGEFLELFQHGEFPSSACATTPGAAAALQQHLARLNPRHRNRKRNKLRLWGARRCASGYRESVV